MSIVFSYTRSLRDFHHTTRRGSFPTISSIPIPLIGILYVTQIGKMFCLYTTLLLNSPVEKTNTLHLENWCFPMFTTNLYLVFGMGILRIFRLLFYRTPNNLNNNINKLILRGTIRIDGRNIRRTISFIRRLPSRPPNLNIRLHFHHLLTRRVPGTIHHTRRNLRNVNNSLFRHLIPNRFRTTILVPTRVTFRRLLNTLRTILLRGVNRRPIRRNLADLQTPLIRRIRNLIRRNLTTHLAKGMRFTHHDLSGTPNIILWPLRNPISNNTTTLNSRLGGDIRNVNTFTRIPTLRVNTDIQISYSLSTTGFTNFPNIMNFHLTLTMNMNGTRNVLTNLSRHRRLPRNATRTIRTTNRIRHLFGALRILNRTRPMRTINHLNVRNDARTLKRNVRRDLYHLYHRLHPIRRLPYNNSLLTPIPIHHIRLYHVRPILCIHMATGNFSLVKDYLHDEQVEYVPIHYYFHDAFLHFRTIFRAIPISTTLTKYCADNDVMVFDWHFKHVPKINGNVREKLQRQYQGDKGFFIWHFKHVSKITFDNVREKTRDFHCFF